MQLYFRALRVLCDATCDVNSTSRFWERFRCELRLNTLSTGSYFKIFFYEFQDFGEIHVYIYMGNFLTMGN